MNLFIRLKIARELNADKLKSATFLILTFISLSLHAHIVNQGYLSLLKSWPFLLIDLFFLAITICSLSRVFMWKELKSSTNQVDSS